jgi:hypothetical protein
LGTEAQEDECFQAQSIAARSVEVEELFGGVQSSQKLRRSQHFYMHNENLGKGARREERSKG